MDPAEVDAELQRERRRVSALVEQRARRAALLADSDDDDDDDDGRGVRWPVRPAPPRLSHPYAQYTGVWPQARSRAQVGLAMRQARRRKARRTDREGRGDPEDVGATLLADGVADPLLERLRSQLPLSALGALGSSCRALREELREELAAAREVLCDGAFALPGPGLPRCVSPRGGWAALAMELRALERRVRPRIHGAMDGWSSHHPSSWGGPAMDGPPRRSCAIANFPARGLTSRDGERRLCSGLQPEHLSEVVADFFAGRLDSTEIGSVLGLLGNIEYEHYGNRTAWVDCVIVTTAGHVEVWSGYQFCGLEGPTYSGYFTPCSYRAMSRGRDLKELQGKVDVRSSIMCAPGTAAASRAGHMFPWGQHSTTRARAPRRALSALRLASLRGSWDAAESRPHVSLGAHGGHLLTAYAPQPLQLEASLREGGAGALPSDMAAMAEAIAFSTSDWRGPLFVPEFELKPYISLLVEPIERRSWAWPLLLEAPPGGSAQAADIVFPPGEARDWFVLYYDADDVAGMLWAFAAAFPALAWVGQGRWTHGNCYNCYDFAGRTLQRRRTPSRDVNPEQRRREGNALWHDLRIVHPA